MQDKLVKKINIEKALKMAIIHDLPEVIAGDESALGEDGTGKKSYAYNKIEKQKRFVNERNAAKELFSKISGRKGNELYKLWLGYEKKESYEAKVVKALDRIECMMQVLEYRKGHMFKKHLEFTINYSITGSEIDPAIEKLGKHIANELKKKFKEFKK